MVQYLKGIHFTLDSWMKIRDEDGWRMTAETQRMFLCKSGHLNELPVSQEKHCPKFVAAVKRLAGDVRTLTALTDSLVPLQRLVQPKVTATAIYGFGDASGSGFGSILQIDKLIHYRHGQ